MHDPTNAEEAKAAGFISCKLQTRGQLIKLVLIPPFTIMPEVLIWGDRVFVRCRKTEVYEEKQTFIVTIEEQSDNDKS